MTTPGQHEGRPWNCTNPECKDVKGRPTKLGFVTAQGDLVVTTPGTLIELGRLAVLVRCPCGQGKAFSAGRKVWMRVPVVQATEAA